MSNKAATKDPYNEISKGNLNAGDLSLFCYQLSLIFKSGIPFLEGMHLFAEEISDSKHKQLSQSLYQDVFTGMSLPDALEKQKAFPSYMVNIIRMAEATGTLDSELERLSSYYDKLDKLKRKVQNAVTYPVILAALMGGIILLLILKILPMFHEILIAAGGDIPPVTQLLLDISGLIRNYSILILILIAVLAAACIFFLRTAAGRQKWDQHKLKSPLMKNIHQKMIAARFGMGMSMLLKGGLSFDDALGMVCGIVGNSYAARKIKACQQDIRDGADPADALEKIGLFPALFMKMLHIGYQTGELEKSMDKIADIYENEAERYLSKITSSIEPVLVIILSLIVGIILLAVMLPLISIMSSIG